VVCIFLYFIKSSVECTLHLYIEFLIIFYFKVYQAVMYLQHCLIASVVDTGEKFIGGDVDAGEQSFGGVVDTAAIFHFAYDYSIG
jgi:hypothetical protein